MKEYTLNTGDRIPALGLGTWTSLEPEMGTAINAAIDAGYRHIDCAPIYGNEPAIGNTLHTLLTKRKVTRDALWITSKLWNSFHRPEDVMQACKQSLHDLQLDYLDLYLVHWPIAFHSKVGYRMPEHKDELLGLDVIPDEETWEAMGECVAAGLVKNIGVSNFSLQRLKRLCDRTTIKPVVNQVECHLYFPQIELNEFCLEHQIYLTAYSPLGSGGRPDALRKENEPTLLDHELVLALADKYHKSPAQIILAWLLERNIIVIPKSTNPKRITENFESQQVSLSLEEVRELNALDLCYRFFTATFWEIAGHPFKAEDVWK